MVGESQEAVGAGVGGSSSGSNKMPTLEEYGTNLTRQAEEVRWARACSVCGRRQLMCVGGGGWNVQGLMCCPWGGDNCPGACVLSFAGANGMAHAFLWGETLNAVLLIGIRGNAVYSNGRC